MFTNVQFDPSYYLHGTYLSCYKIPHKPVEAYIDRNEVDGMCNTTFKLIKISLSLSLEGIYINSVLYVGTTKGKNRRM